jgi:hypothetical protein
MKSGNREKERKLGFRKSARTTRSTLAKTASPDLGRRGAMTGDRIGDRNERERKVSYTLLHWEKCDRFSAVDTTWISVY